MKKAVEDLSCEVSYLKNLISSLNSCGNLPLKPPILSESPLSEPQSASSILPQPSSCTPWQSHFLAASAFDDSKFHVVMFGVPELPQASSCFMIRQRNFINISTTISNLESGSNHKSSIHDCHCIRKYESSKSHPILVSLSSTFDFRNILSETHSLPSSVSIKSDRSVAERKDESMILRERWKLIHSGADCCSIRLRGSALYISGQLHGRVIESVFTLTPHLGDLAPHSCALSSNSPPSLPVASAPVSLFCFRISVSSFL